MFCIPTQLVNKDLLLVWSTPVIYVPPPLKLTVSKMYLSLPTLAEVEKFILVSPLNVTNEE